MIREYFSGLLEFVSGWQAAAAFRYPCLTSAAEASLATPRRSYSVSPYNCFSSSLASIFFACETWRSLRCFSSSLRRSADSRNLRSAAASSRNLFSAAAWSICARFSCTKASTFGALDCLALMGTSSRLDFLRGTTPASSCLAVRSSASATRAASRAAARSASSLLTRVCFSFTSASNAVIFFCSLIVSCAGAACIRVGLLAEGVATKACVQARARATASRIVVLLCTREQIFLPKIGRQIFASATDAIPNALRVSEQCCYRAEAALAAFSNK